MGNDESHHLEAVGRSVAKAIAATSRGKLEVVEPENWLRGGLACEDANWFVSYEILGSAAVEAASPSNASHDAAMAVRIEALEVAIAPFARSYKFEGIALRQDEKWLRRKYGLHYSNFEHAAVTLGKSGDAHD